MPMAVVMSSPRCVTLRAVLLYCLVALGHCSQEPVQPRQQQHQQQRQRQQAGKPNILLVVADDLDAGLKSVERAMNATLRTFQQRGSIFRNAFVTTPVCCPSRSSMLSGLYAHNHGALTNNAECNGDFWRSNVENTTIGVRMQQAGYYTAFIGKYLNNLDPARVPPGWNRWFVQQGNSRYFDFDMLSATSSDSSPPPDITRIRYAGHDKINYFTTVIQKEALKQLDQQSFLERDRRPLFAVIGLPAPHGRADALPKHQRKFPKASVPKTPNFNVRSEDKHWIMRFRHKLSESELKVVDFTYRRRLQTLLSVDEFLMRIFKKLTKTNQLNNTYIFFTSDHGFHLGQFAQLKGKNQPYEDDIRVPLFAVGPGIPRGEIIDQIVLNIDLAPTFLDIARVHPKPIDMDGMSIMPLLKKIRLMKKRKVDRSNIMWRTSFLVSKFKAQQRNYSSEGFPLFDWTSRERRSHDLQRRTKPFQETLDTSGKVIRYLRQYSFPRSRDNVTITTNTTVRVRALNVVKLVRWMQRSQCRPIQVCTLRYLRSQNINSDKNPAVSPAAQLLPALRVRARRGVVIEGEFSSLLSEAEACNCTSTQLRDRCRYNGDGWECDQYAPCQERTTLESGLEHQRCNRAKECSRVGIGCQLISTRHWHTQPLYTGPDICHCANTRNSSYWCERRIDTQHNYLFCKFVTGFEEFFDMRKDPYQLDNQHQYIRDRPPVRQHLLSRLSHMRTCRGHRQCFTTQHNMTMLSTDNSWQSPSDFQPLPETVPMDDEPVN